MKVRIAFVAGHLLHASLNSGGDLLFAHIARELCTMHPEWEIAVVAPSYAAQDLQKYFETVLEIPVDPLEIKRFARSEWSIATAWYKRIRETTRILLEYRPDIVHATGDFFPNVQSCITVKKRSGCAFTGVVHHLNAPPWARQNAFSSATVSYLLQRSSLHALKRFCDRISLLNGEAFNALVARGFPPGRLAIVGAGIDSETYDLAPPPPDQKRILWVHRLEPTKGVADLPDVLAALPPDASLDIVGRGSQSCLEDLWSALRRGGMAERVRYHGYADDQQLKELYERANVFISCSYEEGWGISLCEALSVGIPSLAYRLPSHNDIFGDILETVPVGDRSAFAAKLRALLKVPDTEAARLARHLQVAKYSFAAAARRQGAVFSDVLKKRS